MKKSDRTIKVQDLPMLGRTLDVNQMINTRAFEITEMETQIRESQFAGRKQIHQTVKRFMRRRVASINVKRLPKSLQAKAIEQNSKTQTRQKSRKAIRKRIFKTFNEKWLETHLWHAKRFKMVNKYNLRLAYSNNQKNSRFMYRTLRDSCLLTDQSYYKVLEIIGTEQDIETLFNGIGDPSVAKITSKHKRGKLFIHGFNAYPLDTIARVSFLWQGIITDLKFHTLWIWVHADQYDEVANLIIEKSTCLKVCKLRNDIINFDLIGPRALSILMHCLDLVNSTEANLASHETWNELRTIPSSAFPPDIVFSLLVCDFRASESKIMPRREDLDSEQSQSTLYAKIFNNWPTNISKSNIWHKDFRDKTLIRPSISQLNDIRSTVDNGDQALSDIHIPIIVSHSNSVWNLIAPKGWGSSILNRLYMAGCRVGGILERRVFDYESGSAGFPQDYPEVSTYMKDLKEDFDQKSKKYNGTPTNRRFNYKLKGVVPFRPAFEIFGKDKFATLDVLHSDRMIHCVEVALLQPLENFVPYVVAEVYKLLQKRSFLSLLKNINVEAFSSMFVRIGLTLPVGNISKNAVVHLWSEESLIIDQIIAKDQIIGFVISGGYSLSNAKSFGIAVVTLKSFWSLMNKSAQVGRSLRGEVGVKSPTARLSYKAIVTLIT